jgi:hypothetical protein
VLLDASHRRWLVATVAMAVVATAIYVPYAWSSPRGPRGGSWIGLGFGIVTSAFMVYPALLGLRRRVPTWRVGRASTWLRGHLWLGLLGYLLVFYHAGFRWSGALTALLMVLYTVVVASGIWGVFVQQRVPSMMLEAVPLETVYEQIESVVVQLRAEADELVSRLAGPLPPAPARDAAHQPAGAAATAVAGPITGAPTLRETYLTDIRPYLSPRPPRGSRLDNPRDRATLFEQLRTVVAPAGHDVVDELRAICDERRQLAQQKRLHHWLHGWLLVHVPVSMALLVLAAVHAVVSLRY